MMQAYRDGTASPLLTAGVDEEPVEIVNAGASSPLLLICEHAGRAIPRSLGDLGLDAEQRARHIAYDIGAGNVARRLAERFGCPLVLQRYSRLVIDCNRPPGTKQSIPEISDRTPVPGNIGISATDRHRREQEIFAPYADHCHRQLARPDVRFIYTIHSFTPAMNGIARPWDIGFLYRDARSRGDELVARAKISWPDLIIGRNQPYQIEPETDWFIPVCAEPKSVPHALIEIRNDHLRSDSDCGKWGDRLHRLLSDFMERTDDPYP